MTAKALTIYLVVIHLISFGQEDPTHLNFKKYTVEDGLSQATVNSFAMDARGLMWIGTDDGLNRFDGYQFKTYRHVGGKASLSNNVVMDVKADSDGHLWVATANGLTCFNLLTDSISTYTFNSKNNFYSSLAIDSALQRIWLAAGQDGLRYFDLQDHAIHEFVDPSLSKLNVVVVTVAHDLVFCGTINNGLKVLDVAHAKQLPLSQLTQDPLLMTATVRAILVDDDAVWVGTEGAGMFKVSFGDDKVDIYTLANGGLSSDNVWAIARGPYGKIWVGTDGGGLNIIDASHTYVNVFEYDEMRSVSGNTIRAIYVDAQHNAWLGTYNNGINFYNPLNRFMGYMQNKKGGADTRSATAFVEDDTQRLYVGTGGAGLSTFDAATATLTPVKGAPKEMKNILSLWYNKKYKELWVGTFGEGLYLFANNSWTTFTRQPDESSICDNTIWEITEDSQGNVWLATDRGICYFDRAKNAFQNYLFNDADSPVFSVAQIRSLYTAHDGKIWVGSFGFLGVIDPVSRQFHHFENDPADSTSLSNNIVVSLFEDQQHVMWSGTYGGGLNKLETRPPSFTTYDETYALPNNVIYTIEGDKEGILWMGTNRGIVAFDPQAETYRLFTSEDGVQNGSSHVGASFARADGLLFFGGEKGFNWFYPDSLKRYTDRHLKVTLVEMSANNKEIPCHTLMDGNWKIPHQQSIQIAFVFSTLQYSRTDQIRYSYKVKGLQENWSPAQRDRKIGFSNLNPGTYTLMVRAGMGNKWSDAVTSIEFEVLTPWWQTRFARFIFIFLVGVTIAGLYRYRTHQLVHRKRELERLVTVQSFEIVAQNEELMTQNEELTEQNEEMATQQLALDEAHKMLYEINQALEKTVDVRTEALNETIEKLNGTIKQLDSLLYSASHDLVAPLRSVMGLVALVRQESSLEDAMGYIDLIDTSVRKLDHLIQNLLQQSRNLRTPITLVEVNIEETIQDIIAELKYLPNYDLMSFNIDVPDGTRIMTDYYRIRIILSNLIGNAVKYCDHGKTARKISVRYKVANDQQEVEVWDNGIGIRNEYQGSIFDMFFRATEKATGSGLGLYIVKQSVERLNGTIKINSEYGKWTVFTIVLPLAKNEV